MRGQVKWGRAAVAGLAANVASFFVGGGGYLLFGWTFRLEPTAIWRWTPDRLWDMSAGWWIYLGIGNTVLGLLLGCAFRRIPIFVPRPCSSSGHGGSRTAIGNLAPRCWSGRWR